MAIAWSKRSPEKVAADFLNAEYDSFEDRASKNGNDDVIAFSTAANHSASVLNFVLAYCSAKAWKTSL